MYIYFIFRKISGEVFPAGSAGVFRQKSLSSCDRPLLSPSPTAITLSGCARAARQSIGNIGNILSRKMAATTSTPPIPWPNTKDDYELREVIGS